MAERVSAAIDPHSSSSCLTNPYFFGRFKKSIASLRVMKHHLIAARLMGVTMGESRWEKRRKSWRLLPSRGSRRRAFTLSVASPGLPFKSCLLAGGRGSCAPR